MLNKITTPAPAGGMTGSPTRRATDIAQHTARGVCLRLCQLCPIVFRIFVCEVCRLAKHFVFVIMPFSSFLLLIKIARKDPSDLTSCSVRNLIFLTLSRPHFTEAKLRSALHLAIVPLSTLVFPYYQLYRYFLLAHRLCLALPLS